MNSLKNYGVQELNAKEMKETDGGIGILGAITIFMFASYVIDNWDQVKKGFADGYNAV